MISTTTYQQSALRSANGGYRYFFNGQESDNEVYGEGGLNGFEFRQYDTRLGRWWGVDFIDFCENILKLYNNGRFKDGIPSMYNSDFIETPSDMIEIKENEQIERKALYEQESI